MSTVSRRTSDKPALYARARINPRLSDAMPRRHARSVERAPLAASQDTPVRGPRPDINRKQRLLSGLLASLTVLSFSLAPVEVNAETGTPLPAESADDSSAQAKVDKARKLAKLQRFEEACALVEEAWLILEDPELLRMLGEWHLAMGRYTRAVGFFDSYLEDPDVAESSKNKVRPRRLEALTAAGDKEARRDSDAGASTETSYDDVVEGWQFHDAGENPGGGFYLALGAQYTHNEGGDFTLPASDEGFEGGQDELQTWVHGGIGFRLEAGRYLTDNLGVGFSFGHDWMNWEHRAPSIALQTTTFSGHRPELSLHGRWFFGTGFFAGASTGADLVYLTEGADIQAICETQGGDCDMLEPIKVEEGLQGWRWFVGPTLGFRTEVAAPLTIGVLLDFKYVPVFSATTALAESLEGYTDASWMINGALMINWNLVP